MSKEYNVKISGVKLAVVEAEPAVLKAFDEKRAGAVRNIDTSDVPSDEFEALLKAGFKKLDNLR